MVYSRDEHITPWQHVVEYPVSLLDNEFDLNVIDTVLYYCLYKCSLDVDYCMEEVIEYTLKNYYGSFEKYSINNFIYQLDLNHAGKHGYYVTQSNYEINELLIVFDTFNELKAQAIELYQVNSILVYFEFYDNEQTIIEKTKRLFNQIESKIPMQKQNIKSLIRLKKSGLFLPKN